MSGGQSISAIGNGTNTDIYGFNNPAMIAAMSGLNTMNPAMSMMGGYGSTMNPMMNMMNPMFMGAAGIYNNQYMDQQMEMLKKFQQYNEEMEKYKLQHATEMHAMTQQAEVYNLSAHDKAFFEKAMVDGYVQQGIREIFDAIRKGNQDYAVKKFYELKQGILTKYSDYFNSAEGYKNSQENINNLIRLLYAEIGAGFTGGIKPDLINDIQTYGENAFMHGFHKRFLGNSGHNKLNAEEALNQMFGTGINDEGSKRHAEQLGEIGAAIAEPVCAGAAGAVAGLTALGFANTLPKIGKHFRGHGKLGGASKWAWVGAGLAALADIAWQNGLIGNRA